MKVEVFLKNQDIYLKTINKDGSEGNLYNFTATRIILENIKEDNIKHLKLKDNKLTFKNGNYNFIIDNYEEIKSTKALKNFNLTIDNLLNKKRLCFKLLSAYQTKKVNKKYTI